MVNEKQPEPVKQPERQIMTPERRATLKAQGVTDEQINEVIVRDLMSRMGECHTWAAERFIALWPKEDPNLIREALQRKRVAAGYGP